MTELACMLCGITQMFSRASHPLPILSLFLPVYVLFQDVLTGAAHNLLVPLSSLRINDGAIMRRTI